MVRSYARNQVEYPGYALIPLIKSSFGSYIYPESLIEESSGIYLSRVGFLLKKLKHLPISNKWKILELKL